MNLHHVCSPLTKKDHGWEHGDILELCLQKTSEQFLGIHSAFSDSFGKNNCPWTNLNTGQQDKEKDLTGTGTVNMD